MSNILFEHIKSVRIGRWTKTRFLKGFALLRMRQNRGSTYMGEIYAIARDGSIFMTPLVLLNVWLKARYNWEIPLWWSFLFIVGFFMTTYIIGYYDENKLKLWQVESEMGMKRVNPYYQRLERNIDKIMLELDEIKKRGETKHARQRTRG
jgi:hypothetical protein